MSKHLLHEPFLARARAQPAAIALVQGSERLSYGDLERRSRVLAGHLRRGGVEVGDRVGIALSKSLDAVVAALAILRAGGAYVPLDEQSPPARQQTVLGDCQVRGVVTTRTAWSRVAGGPSAPRLGPALPARALRDPELVLHLDDLPASSQTPDGEPPPLPSPEDPAYVLYTSGSTGRPKGVVVSHRAARTFVDWAVHTFALDSSDALSSVAQLSFDLSIFDLFAGFAAGATVHLVTRDLLLRPPRLVSWLARAQITTWYSVPSTLAVMLAQGHLAEHPPPALRRVLFAGEVFPMPQLRQLMQALPQARFWNLYGPTETNVCTWHGLPPRLPDDATAIPIGTPCPHAQIAVLDPQGRSVPAGAEGELCVSGTGVMTGYFGRPDLTHTAFWPAGTVPGVGPLYRTGDRVRRNAAGQLWFLGRWDQQIKHRGYRIELGEIERVVASLPGVAEAAVVTRPRGSDGLGICAVVVPRPGAQVTVLSVKSHCGQLLPAYMVPAAVEVRQSLPRTSTGKVDWQRLR